MEYDDGAYTLFFNTRGTKGECADEVRALLHYMEHSDDEESVISEKLRRIREIISEVKLDPEAEAELLKLRHRFEELQKR